MFFRPLKPLWEPAKEALEAYFHAYFGEPEEEYDINFKVLRGEDGVYTRVSLAEWSAAFTTHATRATQSFVEVVDQAEFMWNDEFLT